MSDQVDFKEVFGIKINKLPLSYIQRKDVSRKYTDAVSEGLHIILYGGTKQGKTSFLLNHYGATIPEFIRVDGGMSIQDLNNKIFKNILLSEKKLQRNPVVIKSLEDIRQYLRDQGFENRPRTVIIENYHYLLKQKYSKHFLEQMRNSIEGSHQLNIILVGIFKDQDITTYVNGDLSGRITSITLEPWSDDLLGEIITKGLQLLGIEIEDRFRNMIIENSFGNVAILQDLMKNIVELYMSDRNNLKTKVPIRMKDELEYSSVCGKVINNIVGSYGRKLISNLLTFKEEKIQINRKPICPIVASYFLKEWERPSSEVKIQNILDYFYEDSSAAPHPDDARRLSAVVEKFNNFIMKEGTSPSFFIGENSVLKILDTYFLFYLNNTLDDTDGVNLDVSME